MATEAQTQENELEKLLKDYQVLQEQLRSMALQVEQLQSQKMDMERAKEELDKATGKVYISVGGVIVETAKDKALAEIKDRSALNETRFQSANKTYADLRGREKLLNERITKLYRHAQGMA
ncbi:MAG TPA: prefoldin subunit [Candidatus Saccharimonadales bacterium]|nr:prefoldin subunit [Candidatus Saccharimonadales bacterium]